MGHAVTIGTVDKREDIMPFAQRFAEANVDREENPYGDYHGNIHIHDERIYPSFEAASNALMQMAEGGFYSDHAVKFHPTGDYKESAKLKSLKKQVIDKVNAQLKYENDHAVQELKAKLISCKHCGSKVSREHLQGQNCPVCGKDLRSDSVLAKIAWYEEKIKDLERRIDEEDARLRDKACNKAKTLWAVKVEVHC